MQRGSPGRRSRCPHTCCGCGARPNSRNSSARGSSAHNGRSGRPRPLRRPVRSPSGCRGAACRRSPRSRPDRPAREPARSRSGTRRCRRRLRPPRGRPARGCATCRCAAARRPEASPCSCCACSRGSLSSPRPPRCSWRTRSPAAGIRGLHRSLRRSVACRSSATSGRRRTCPTSRASPVWD